MLDSQTIKTSANVHLADQGTDAGKRIIGRKRHLGCDTLGLLLTVLVTAASVSDTAAGVTLLTRIAAAHPQIRKAWVDAGYRTTGPQGSRPRIRRPVAALDRPGTRHDRALGLRPVDAVDDAGIEPRAASPCWMPRIDPRWKICPPQLRRRWWEVSRPG
ncbi:hypothetical protein GCM10010449_39210 [Streptomyces rectiviolaceus]|uniref:Transposase IS4-like domain-containing protein n=1 Tax=Streptomyces rectiviolaceus TaxID=332591 RepID=A0ABP6MGU5_9ACTN